jgi:hypothetical protein
MMPPFVWPLMAAASLIRIYQVRGERWGSWFAATVFALGAVSGALAALN